MGGVQGQAADISIQAKEILRMRDRLNEILACIPASRSRISRRIRTAISHVRAESRDYGLVDEVVKSRRDGEKKPEKAA